jgi:arylformamidase
MLYDITRVLTPRTAVFPGDTPVTVTPVLQLRNGDSCNVTGIAMSSHAGTHVDAPRHYSDAGIGIDAVPLDVLMGPVTVISIAVRGPITMEHVMRQAASLPHGRLIVHTRASDTADDIWEPEFASFTPEAADWLGAHGVRLIGTDAPSVDPASSKDLPAHLAFLRHGTIIIENLRLRGVPDGDYELIALPLRIAGNDAAPARVILRV